MPDALPIACSLSSTGLADRLQAMATLGRDALLDSRTDGTRAVLRFAAVAGIRDRVDALVAAESDCCAFLTMGLGEEPDTIVLTIEAPEGADAALGEVVGAFWG